MKILLAGKDKVDCLALLRLLQDSHHEVAEISSKEWLRVCIERWKPNVAIILGHRNQDAVTFISEMDIRSLRTTRFVLVSETLSETDIALAKSLGAFEATRRDDLISRFVETGIIQDRRARIAFRFDDPRPLQHT